MAKPNVQYRPEWYSSEESLKTPYAVSPDEERWSGPEMAAEDSLEVAKAYCEEWGREGEYRTSRIVELEDGVPTSVVWMSVWEAPLAATPSEAGASTGLPGETIKMLVWMDRDEQHLDHKNWQKTFAKILEGDNNAWDLAYARVVNTTGKMVQYSVRINLWPIGKKPIAEWNWHKVFGKDPEKQADEVEIVRTRPIEPRSFPDGVDTVACRQCGKTVEESKAWLSYNTDTDEYDGTFCSCKCIDTAYDTDVLRIDPDGLRHDDPGCVHLVGTIA